jgi:hypothetical protein
MVKQVDGRESNKPDDEGADEYQPDEKQNESVREESTYEQYRPQHTVVQCIHESVEIRKNRIDNVGFVLVGTLAHT